ncbi:uncharacterized protein TNCV_3702 [Trichonephila clavipes]|nr:uncharacterized protein TNCV_3702 [Trichonephila clavipes]
MMRFEKDLYSVQAWDAVAVRSESSTRVVAHHRVQALNLTGYLLRQSVGGTVIDEAHFWLNGYVNKQNCRIWSEANPQVFVETPLHPEKRTVWCALWAGRVLLQNRCGPQRYNQWRSV